MRSQVTLKDKIYRKVICFVIWDQLYKIRERLTNIYVMELELDEV